MSRKQVLYLQLGLLLLLLAVLAARFLDEAAVAVVAAVAGTGLLTVLDLRAQTKADASTQAGAPVVPAAQDAAGFHAEPLAPLAHEAITPLAQEALAPAAPLVTLPDEASSPTPEAPSTAADDALGPSPTADDAPQASTLDFAALADTLVASDAPLAELKRLVGDTRTREAEGATPAPCGLERYAARMLEEAGLFAKDVELPQLTVVHPQASRMLYLRCAEPRVPYLARQRIIKLEAALNALRFACTSLPAGATIEQAYQLNQGLARSIVAQAAPIDQPLDLGDGGAWPEGEWTVRYGISQAIETLQLPYRLQARYRTNVADGNVAIELDMTPADAFPSSCHVDGLGIVPTTGDMRQQAAADYALRLGLLMAASAFRCSARIRHVWVAAILETATRRTCYYSVDFDRWRFARLDLSDLGDLAEAYRSFAPVLRYEDGWLRPVKQGFHLEEERFCPTRRYLPVSLSSRRLTGNEARSLGTDHVSGLAIEEADGRTLVANAIMMRLTPEGEKGATQKNVRTVLDLAGDDPDPTVRSAAERVVHGLVEGTLGADVYAVGEEFVRGDTLTRANDRAKQLLMQQRPLDAHKALEPVIAAIDEAGTYADSPHVAYRYFNSYVERALYNRRAADAGDARTCMLVPDAYYEAHLLLSVTCLMQDRHEDALAHARRIVELGPLDARARLHLVKCLEVLDRDDEAVRELSELLGFAHEPQGIGLAYYRMAFFQWKRGNVSAAQACYQCAMHFLPQAVPMMAMELSVLYLQNPEALQETASEEQIIETLEAAGIPIAPTEATSEVFFDCARASLDAEIFPVARNFARIMAAFSGDDVITGVLRSLEDEPDRL